MTVLDAIAYAVNVENRGTSLEGDHASGVSELTVTSVYNFPATGSVDVNGDVYEYTAVDDDANTVTLSGVTSAAYDDGASVELSPAQPVWYATVVVGSDQLGFNAMVPIHMVPFLAEGFWDEGIPVRIEPIRAGEYEWKVVDVPGQQPVYDARSAPIVVSNDDGEAARVDGDGFSAVTNDDLVALYRVPGFQSPATRGSWIYANDGLGNLHKLAVLDGEEDTNGWPVANCMDQAAISEDEQWVIAVDAATFDLRKISAETGVEDTSGDWPIAGTFVASDGNTAIASSGAWVYAADATTVHKYALADGVEDTTGAWPLALVVDGDGIAAAGDWVVLIDEAADDLHKYAVADAVEDTTGDWPIAGTFSSVSANGDWVYAFEFVTLGPIHKYALADGVEDTTGDWPLSEASQSSGFAVGDVIVVSRGSSDLKVYNLAGHEARTILLASADGRATLSSARLAGTADIDDAVVAGELTVGNTLTVGNSVTVDQAVNADSLDLTGDADIGGSLDVGADLTVTGDAAIAGEAQIDQLLVTTTKFTRTAAQNATTGASTTVDFDTFSGSGASGVTDYWSESAGTITIAEDGVYEIAAQPMVAASATGSRRFQLVINGAAHLDRFEQAFSPSVAHAFPMNTGKIPLAAGDTITLRATQTSGGNLSLAGSWLSIARAGVLAA